MLTQSGEEITVLTPRTRRTNTTVTNLPPTVLFPETRHPTTPIRSVHSDHADDDLYEDRTRDIRSGHNTPSGPPPGGNAPDDPGARRVRQEVVHQVVVHQVEVRILPTQVLLVPVMMMMILSISSGIL